MNSKVIAGVVAAVVVIAAAGGAAAVLMNNKDSEPSSDYTLLDPFLEGKTDNIKAGFTIDASAQMGKSSTKVVMKILSVDSEKKTTKASKEMKTEYDGYCEGTAEDTVEEFLYEYHTTGNKDIVTKSTEGANTVYVFKGTADNNCVLDVTVVAVTSTEKGVSIDGTVKGEKSFTDKDKTTTVKTDMKYETRDGKVYTDGSEETIMEGTATYDDVVTMVKGMIKETFTQKDADDRFPGYKVENTNFGNAECKHYTNLNREGTTNGEIYTYKDIMVKVSADVKYGDESYHASEELKVYMD